MLQTACQHFKTDLSVAVSRYGHEPTIGGRDQSSDEILQHDVIPHMKAQGGMLHVLGVSAAPPR